MKKLLVLVAGGIGYVLGARAGRERYEQIKGMAVKVKDDPRVQDAAHQAADTAKAQAPVVKDKVTSAASAAADKVKPSGSNDSDLEAQLNDRGWTIGHFPDSFKHSTLGGWIATRSSGMQSDRFGDIADITRGLRMVVPGDVLVIRPLPSTATGPSVRESTERSRSSPSTKTSPGGTVTGPK